MSEATDQPVEDEVLPGVEADAPEADADAEVTEPELDENGEPIAANPEDDTDEVEHDGLKHRIPKALAKEFREGTMRQKDYTQKTQEVAAQRQELVARQAEIAQQAEAQATTLEERATLKALDAQLAQYDAVDWGQYTQQHGADEAIKAQGQWQQLQRARAGLETEITRKEAEHRSTRDEAIQSARREAVHLLQTEIGLTPEINVAVDKVAQSYGFSPAELVDTLVTSDGKPDTRAFKVLARLAELEEFKAKHTAKTTTAQTAQRQAAVQPAKTVGQRAGAFKAGLDDDLPPKVWLERRNAQIAAQAKAQGR